MTIDSGNHPQSNTSALERKRCIDRFSPPHPFRTVAKEKEARINTDTIPHHQGSPYASGCHDKSRCPINRTSISPGNGLEIAAKSTNHWKTLSTPRPLEPCDEETKIRNANKRHNGRPQLGHLISPGCTLIAARLVWKSSAKW
ncbi:beta-glucosidase [Anopheles sinensis]|uniref:Beta-glucosidase n=1 Tax=Anopheles sinensis TaxID=74873 RepID=A0A084V9T9_ANOSI|nr:beta-glucosidase [Anopheles sinensis]